MGRFPRVMPANAGIPDTRRRQNFGFLAKRSNPQFPSIHPPVGPHVMSRGGRSIKLLLHDRFLGTRLWSTWWRVPSLRSQ